MLNYSNFAQVRSKVSAKQYARHQFPNPITLPDGTKLQKPVGW